MMCSCNICKRLHCPKDKIYVCKDCGLIVSNSLQLTLHRLKYHTDGLSVTDKKRRYMYEQKVKKKRKLVKKTVTILVPSDCDIIYQKTREDTMVIQVIRTK